MQINQDYEVKIIYLNLPKSLNLNLLFSDFSSVFISKIKFLIHQINYNHFNGGYQLNAKNHSWLLGIKDGELKTIITRLVDNEIIIKTANHQQGKKSNTYSMVTPFDIENQNESDISGYPIDKHLFLQKWVADNYIVKSQINSVFVKNTKSTVNRTLIYKNQSLEVENKALRERIAHLEAQLAASIETVLPDALYKAESDCNMVVQQPFLDIDDLFKDDDECVTIDEDVWVYADAVVEDEDFLKFKKEYLEKEAKAKNQLLEV